MNRRVSDFCVVCDQAWDTCECHCAVCGIGPCICEEDDDGTPTVDEGPFLPDQDEAVLPVEAVEDPAPRLVG